MLVELQSVAPHKSKFLRIDYGPDEVAHFRNVSQYLTVVGGFKMEHIETIRSATFSVPGTGLFKSWTPEENKLYTDRFKRVLRQPDCLGLLKVPYRKLTMHDLI